MEKRKTKKEIVKMLLKNNELAEGDEEELLDLLIDQPISIDVDKQEEAKMTFGDKVADKVSEIAGSWGFILGFILFLLFWIILNGYVLKGEVLIILDDKTRGLKKYKTNSSGEVYPNHEVDNYCFNTMVLNYLSTTPINRLSFEEYSSYLDYLLETNMISNNIYNILINQYTNKYTESIIDYFDEINKNTGRASYKVYKLYKEKIHN